MTHADNSSVPHGDNAIFSSDSGTILESLTPVQKTSLVVLMVSATLLVWAGYVKVTAQSSVAVSEDSANILIDSQPLNLQVTSPDQVAPAAVNTPDVTNVAGESVEVRYQSSQSVSGATGSTESSATMTVNGQQVPVSQNGTKKVIKSQTSGSNSTVVINVDNQSSSSGQSGGSD